MNPVDLLRRAAPPLHYGRKPSFRKRKTHRDWYDLSKGFRS